MTNYFLPEKQDGNGNASGQPVESWKRAAEVTNALKAKIEQMKVMLPSPIHTSHLPAANVSGTNRRGRVLIATSLRAWGLACMYDTRSLERHSRRARAEHFALFLSGC